MATSMNEGGRVKRSEVPFGLIEGRLRVDVIIGTAWWFL